ncbi:hypothetical protein ABPG72_011072 [Tetrahymena utriculariae]
MKKIKYLAFFSYLGRNYHGFQYQKLEGQRFKTIQDSIQQSLNNFAKQEVFIKSSSRTDVGVNARKHPVQFVLQRDSKKKIWDLLTVQRGVNFYLRDAGDQIAINEVYQVPMEFDVRNDCLEKEYVFYIDSQVGYSWENPLLFYKQSWCIPDQIDIDRLNQAFQKYLGRHNFYLFTSPELFQTQFDLFEKELQSFQITLNPHEHFPKIQSIRISVKGKGFLKYQVRYMVGIAVLYAQKKIDENYLNYLLNPTGFIPQEERRNLIRLKAKPEGLFLYDVQYDQKFLHNQIQDDLIVNVPQKQVEDIDQQQQQQT